jgi:two-component system CheB/CheR fusion protein
LKKQAKRGDLRERAEAQLRSRGIPLPADPADALRLVHELQVHQIELELQNEELCETRAALEGALERQTGLFEFAPVGYVAVEGDGRIANANFAAAKLLGATRRQLLGRKLTAFVSKRDVEVVEALLTDVLTVPVNGGHPRSLEVALLSSGDALVGRITAGLGDAGAPTALVTIEDVTARRRAEEALQEELRRRDEFLAILSHELRNPLAPIRNGLYLLQHAEAGSAGAERALAVIERQASHLTRIVDDLLDVTRISRGKLQLRRRVEDLSTLVQRTLDDHRDTFDAAEIALELGADSEPKWADVDPTRIAQILGNLLANALKFTPRGGRVSVGLRAGPRYLWLTVRDTGAGVAPEVLERLFQPFSQGPQGLARTAGGLGLGLATVRGLVELHGGEVTLESAGPGKGTEVRIRLPRIDAPKERPLGGGRHAPSQRVLVIDDNDDAATTLKDVLETCGHAVRTAHDARSGLDAAHEFHPQVVLCDLGLPGLDGFAVARALRADRDEALRLAYLVAVSGYARPEDVERSLEAGFDRHLAKPTSLESLQALLADAGGGASW